MKKRIILLIILLVGIIIPVSAKGTSNFNTGNEITLHDPIGATSFTAGNNVSMDSKIDGANFVAGRSLNLKSIQDIIFAAGQDINLENVETKDAFLAAETINVKQSKIRDLYAAAGTIKINSDIDRNAYLGANSITINSKIDGNVDLAAENITIGDNAIITGTLKYPEDAKINISDSAQVTATKTYKSSSTKEPTILQTIKDMILPFISMLVTGLVLIALNKKNTKQIEEMEKDPATIFKTMGIGFLFLIAVPVVSIIGLVTIVGIPLSIITLIIYGILIFLSVIPAAYYLGIWLLKDKIDNKDIIFAFSLLAIYILKLIPILGGWVGLLTLCLGLGIDIYLIKEHIASRK